MSSNTRVSGSEPTCWSDKCPNRNICCSTGECQYYTTPETPQDSEEVLYATASNYPKRPYQLEGFEWLGPKTQTITISSGVHVEMTWDTEHKNCDVVIKTIPPAAPPQPVATTAADHVKGEIGFCQFHTDVPNGSKLYLTPPPEQPAPVDDAWEAQQKALAQDALDCATKALADPNSQAAKLVREYYKATSPAAPDCKETGVCVATGLACFGQGAPVAERYR